MSKNPCDINVLVACEESQRVCIAFRKLGFNAFSCDIQPCSGGFPEFHFNKDVLSILNPFKIGEWFKAQDGSLHFIDHWDLIIAHPPCTFMSKAGARWMFAGGVINQYRLQKAFEAKRFFMKIWNCSCDKVVIENPTPLKIVGLPLPTQVIQPYKFDPDGLHPYSKRTCLWERGVEPLIETSPFAIPISTWLPSNTGGFSRGKGGCRGIVHNAKDASKTFSGIAHAMAEQWGSYLLSEV